MRRATTCRNGVARQLREATFIPEPPLIHELRPAPAAVDVFRRLASLPGCVFFDSARDAGPLGRYSFVAADPFETVVLDDAQQDGLALLAEALEPFSASTISKLPPFQGGAAGLLGYELGQSLERLPTAKWDEFRAPPFAVGLYDAVVAFDHHAGRAWAISQGFPERTPERRSERAERRLAALLARIEEPVETQVETNGETPSPTASAEPLPRSQLAPQHPVADLPGVTSDFTREGYLRAVARVVEYIHAGDAFQVNLSQRLLTAASGSPVEAYLKLRRRNPAPFGGFFDMGGTQVLSASPERFLSAVDGAVETRPIKGTRRRSSDPSVDQRFAAELLSHGKDRAENVMIVDLLRNDLSRVCEIDSIEVPALCQLESYEHVHHLVSVVTGQLAAGRTPLDLLRASFPGGSITGAPKVRAMEIIAELEPTARGPYCGSLFYAGFNGAMDSSILIRTLVQSRGWRQASVGGGVVADSDPETEYQETWHKAAGLLGETQATSAISSSAT